MNRPEGESPSPAPAFSTDPPVPLARVPVCDDWSYGERHALDYPRYGAATHTSLWSPKGEPKLVPVRYVSLLCEREGYTPLPTRPLADGYPTRYTDDLAEQAAEARHYQSSFAPTDPLPTMLQTPPPATSPREDFRTRARARPAPFRPRQRSLRGPLADEHTGL